MFPSSNCTHSIACFGLSGSSYRETSTAEAMAAASVRDCQHSHYTSDRLCLIMFPSINTFCQRIYDPCRLQILPEGLFLCVCHWLVFGPPCCVTKWHEQKYELLQRDTASDVLFWNATRPGHCLVRPA
jgi:hypothetical protein